VSGLQHSQFRPKFCQDLGLWQGTINIQLPAATDESILIPLDKIPGRDPIDFDSNQDFLIRPCKLKGISGYQILPIDKTTGEPRGHHSAKLIEITLRERIDLQPGEELEVELQGFED
jgi:CTP-dependent riboflavin kinase